MAEYEVRDPLDIFAGKIDIRLAYRREGEFWMAYLARKDTMIAAQPVGSIAMDAVRGNNTLRSQFMTNMRAAADVIIEQKTGKKPAEWGEMTQAPAHEVTNRKAN